MSEMQTSGTRHQHTLCWDCENATGGCSWADWGEHKPVNGWTAIKTQVKCHNPSGLEEKSCSYIVVDCPEFIRNAEGFGLRRIGKGQTADHICDADAVVQAYQCGVRIEEIMRIERCSRSTIYKILREAGIKKRERKTP